MLLGHRTYLKAKARGDNSMFGKAGCSETTKLHAGRGPDGMVKARLLEPKSPICTTSDRTRWFESEVPQDSPSRILAGQSDQESRIWPQHAPGEQGRICDLKGTKWAPTAVLNVTYVRNAGFPNGREPYGNGAPIVVGVRESRTHGEVGQVNRMSAGGGT